jgi:uncharacterized surface protein with fasciclin (FAS1) repeats
LFEFFIKPASVTGQINLPRFGVFFYLISGDHRGREKTRRINCRLSTKSFCYPKTKFMKRSFLKLVILAASGLVIFESCHKDNNPTPTPVTNSPLQEYISGDTSLSIFNAAITKSGNASLYAGSDSVTVLAPTNDAFRAAGITQSTIAGMSSSAVDSLLRYHFINQSADLANGKYNTYTSDLGSRVYGYGGTTDSNYFNGAQATKVAVTNSKATVYRLNTVLNVPYASGSSYLSSDTSLTYFNEALRRSGIDLSTDTGWNTVLVPTNSAFRAAGYDSLGAIDNLDSASLRSALMYHILPGQYFANSYTGLTTVPTSVTGSNISIGTSPNGATFSGAGNTTPVGFAGNSVLAGNNTIYQPVNGIVMQ